MTGLRTLSGDKPRLNPEFERGSSTLRPLEVVMAGWGSCCGRGATLFGLLLPPPGLNREAILLVWDLGERFGFEE
jgi:hypothetical protein